MSTRTDKWEIEFFPKPQSNSIDLTGKIDVELVWNQRDRIGTQIIQTIGKIANPFGGPKDLTKTTVAKTVITGSLRLDPTSDGIGFSLTLGCTYEFSTPTLTHSVKGYTLSVIEAFKGKTDAEIAAALVKDASDKIRNALDSSLKKLTVNVKETAFVPPGESVFVFRKPRFSNKFDLLMDVTYKASKPQPKA